MHTYTTERESGQPAIYTVCFYFPGCPNSTGTEIKSFHSEADAQALVNYLNGGPAAPPRAQGRKSADDADLHYRTGYADAQRYYEGR